MFPVFDLSHPSYLKQVSYQQGNSPYTIPQNDAAQDVGKNLSAHILPLDNLQQVNTRNDGKWSLRQIMRYYNFLLQFKDLFKSKEERKSKRIFALMAKHIRSRKTTQCKSHHQKIQKNYHSIQQIISYYEKILSPLKQQWKEFIRTENTVLINAFTQINKSQNYYQILQFKNMIRIYIKQDSIKTYDS